MWVSALAIEGFRGIRRASFKLDQHSVFVGPNGSGKSTLVDSLSLVLGRNKMVRPLSEYDFFGGDPKPADRFRVIATLTGFLGDSNANLDWFRAGRAVPKWTDRDGKVYASHALGRELCAQIAFAARFDRDELSVESIRYFHDDDSVVDPFSDDTQVEAIPTRLLNDLGYFVLPARRSWDGAASFNSELFRKVVSSVSGIPSAEILDQRDRVRNPDRPVEASPQLAGLVDRINTQIAGLMVQHPEFKLRLTAGDAEAVLQALMPHYSTAGVTLPVSRQGSGLVSLQTLLLLLEVGRGRKAKGLPFVLALEEPELHLAPGLQSRLIAEAVQVAGQTICTTHSPQVAAQHEPTQIFIMSEREGRTEAVPFLSKPLPQTARNAERRLYIQNRASAVQAIMHPFVLVPEGRFDGEWLRRLASIAEGSQSKAPFTSVFGLAPTEDGAVVFLTERIRRLRRGVLALVDGDSAGDGYATELALLEAPPDGVLAWPVDWTIEDVVVWVLEAEAVPVSAELAAALAPQWPIATMSELRTALKTKNDAKARVVGLKEDVIVHDAIIGIAREHAACVARSASVLDAIVSAARAEPHPLLGPSLPSTGGLRRILLS